ncbi:hypothetical protein JXA47_08245 [Candidatus Sumerlaeota bacterium]|nr:hypothetical protein [Candidatus Sumerlaeota bacterium]
MRLRLGILIALLPVAVIRAERVSPLSEEQFEAIWGASDGLMATIVRQLESHSGRRYPVIPSETGNWGQAHPAGVIVFDVSASALDEAIVAGLLAHEWGHLVLGHPQRVLAAGQDPSLGLRIRAFEREADAYAARFLATWNYDVEPLAQFLESSPPAQMASTFGHPSHDTGSERAALVRTVFAEAQALASTQQPTTVATPAASAADDAVCPTCQGTQRLVERVPCPVCGGLGRVVCQWCLGGGVQATPGGLAPCESCGGQGYLVCQRCGGEGWITSSRPCPDCALRKH